jgi:hypothetical protein
MFGRSKWFIIIPVFILIPILLGMTPLNFLHNLGSGCAFSHDKQVQKCSPPFLNSQESPDDHLLPIHPFGAFNRDAGSLFFGSVLNFESLPPARFSEFAPLRR